MKTIENHCKTNKNHWKTNKINQKRPRTIEKPIKTKKNQTNQWKEPKKQKQPMFSHTSPPNPAPGPTSVRKHFCFLFFWFFSLFFFGFSLVFIGFSMVLDLFWLILLVFQWFSLVLQWFWTFFITFIKKLIENQSQPTPGPLRSFLLGVTERGE